MRIRSIKPEFWRSDDITELDWQDRLIFVGLWSYVDDNGVGMDRLASVAADLFAGDLERDSSGTFARVSRGLQNLFSAGRITRYTVAGKKYLHITNWEKHQRIDKPNKPRFPHPTGENVEIRESVANDSREAPEIPASGTGEQGNRGTGEQGKKDTSPTAMEKAFSRAWSHWPKKVERKKAHDQFIRASKKWEPGSNGLASEDLAFCIAEFGDAYAATTERQFVPALGVWLSGERWTDELPQAPTQGSGKPTPEQRAYQTMSLAMDIDMKELGQ